MMACLDVFYRTTHATAACLLFNDWRDSAAAAEAVRVLSPVPPYEAGYFYRRELPCLLAVLAVIPCQPEIVIVDAYVWLDRDGRPGLGAYLHEALGKRAAVVGVAKSLYPGAPAIPVQRGRSRSPLFVSTAGLAAEDAARHVAGMSGAFRIPTLLKRVDQLCRTYV